jgi:hypothetical protein
MCKFYIKLVAGNFVISSNNLFSKRNRNKARLKTVKNIIDSTSNGHERFADCYENGESEKKIFSTNKRINHFNDIGRF